MSIPRDQKHLNELFKLAMAVEEPVGCSRMAACIVMHNRVVSYGLPSYKTHPIQSKFSKTPGLAIYLHAETCAIKNALRIIDISDLEKCTLYICRAKYTDEKRTSIVTGLAKPCEGCARAIATFGIKRVVYSLDNEGWESIIQ